MEKAKRKGNPQKAHRRFALVLLGFIVFSMSINIIVLFEYSPFDVPFLVLQKPFTNLTPILYSLISLIWVPVAVEHQQNHGISKLLWVLIITCVLSVALMIWFQYQLFILDGWCPPHFESIPFTPFAIYERWLCVGLF